MRTSRIAIAVTTLGVSAWATTETGGATTHTSNQSAAQPADAAAPAPTPAEQPTPSLLQAWEGRVDIALTGTTGNSESNNFRVELGLDRETERNDTAVRALYRYGTSDGAEGENRAQIGLRNDYKFADSRWLLFGEVKYEYDNFQDWDHRISFAVGPGYRLLVGPKHMLTGRVGYGAFYEVGGDNEEYQSEVVIGVDYKWNIKDKHTFELTSEYRPSLEDSNNYRILSRANYDILLDESSNLYLRLGAESRYDSDPGPDRRRHDVDYFLALGWTF